jgi:hypothetical protein
MRARHDTQWAGSRAALVEMYPNCYERLEDRERWLHEKDALLFGPASAIGMCDAIAYRDTQVLVQRHEPVPARGLVKQRALYGDGGGRKMLSDRGEALEAQRELSAAGVMK